MDKKQVPPKVQALLPAGTGRALVFAAALSVIGVIFARLTASKVPDPSTGQIYQIYFGRRQSYWYLDFWHLILYRVLTVPSL
jgi:hypothetical protein